MSRSPAFVPLVAVFLVGVIAGGAGYRLRAIHRLREAAAANVGHASDRFSNVAGKRRVSCPPQTTRTMVLLTIGQSNAANHAGQRYASTNPTRVVNWFRGACYAAASPLLGASGTGGESWSLLGDSLIARHAADAVVIVPAAVGNTSIHQWVGNSDIAQSLDSTVRGVMVTYRVTAVLWHQGENDWRFGTTDSAYERDLTSLFTHLRSLGVTAPRYIAVASLSGPALDVRPVRDNPIRAAQKRYVVATGASLGPDTDSLITRFDRLPDDVHFSWTGQQKFSAAWVRILDCHTPRMTRTALK